MSKTIKVPLSKIKNKNIDYSLLFDAIKRSNKLIFEGYHFLRLFILDYYEYPKNNSFLNINNEFIMMSFKALSKKSTGPRPGGTNMEIYSEMCNFFDKTFVKLLPTFKKKQEYNSEDYKISATNLSYILHEASKGMIIAIENNIRLNFFKYLNQFVNESFKYGSSKSYNFRLELRKVKDDLINNTLESDQKYHQWIKEIKTKILPIDYIKNYEHDINIAPLKYLRYMINMNKILETNKTAKMYQFFPLRKEIKLKYVTINTSALIDIFIKERKNDFFKHVRELQNSLWDTYFNIDKFHSKRGKLKLKNHSFNYQIQTDGFATSLNFIRNDEIEKMNIKKDRKKNALAKTKNENKGKSDDDIMKSKEDKKNIKVKICSDNKLKNDQKKKENKLKFKKLSKNEQEKIKLDLRMKNEIVHLEDVIKIETYKKHLTEQLNNNKMVYIDPGMRSPLYMLGNCECNDVCKCKTPREAFFNYTNRSRINATKRLKYNRLINNYNNKHKIQNKTLTEINAELTTYNSKTVNIKKFMEYIKEKFKILPDIDKEYDETYVRKLNWFSYLNKRRHEDQLINKIKDKYGKDITIVIGDWGNKGGIKHMSTPGIGLKRKLKEHFEIYLMDEYKTSQLNYLTEEKNINLKLKIKGNDGKVRERLSHAILTYQMGNNRIGCINRDKNSALNHKKIATSIIRTGERPKKFKRGNQNENHEPSLTENDSSKGCQVMISSEAGIKARTRKPTEKKQKETPASQRSAYRAKKRKEQPTDKYDRKTKKEQQPIN